jgi:hypothetical protein
MAEDARKQPRFPLKNTVFIELASPESGSRNPGAIARGTTVDISRGGLRVNLGQELLIGAILQVGVELPARAGTLYLIGEVRWCHQVPGTETEPAWTAGLALLNADDADIDSWMALLNTMEH